MLQGSTCIIIKDDNDLEEIRKRDPAMYEGLQQGEIESLVLFPLKHGEHILGYIWALNFDTENYIKIKETLELTTFFVASEVANHVLVEQLRNLSSVDLLTGTMNRNIMNNRVDRVIAGKDILEEPYTIVFTDMNGLKRLNDTEGHNAGDDSLKQAAAILTDVFYDGEVYRVGGDEFMVIACKIEPEEVEAAAPEEVPADTDVRRQETLLRRTSRQDLPPVKLCKALYLGYNQKYLRDREEYRICRFFRTRSRRTSLTSRR